MNSKPESKSIKRFLTLGFIILWTTIISGCGLAPKIPPVSELPATPAGGQGQTAIVDYTFDEVYEAAKESLIRLNLTLQQEDENAGKLLANGVGGLQRQAGWHMAVGIYIQEINADPKTRVQVVAVPDWSGWTETEYAMVQGGILNEIQQVLLTY